MFMHRLRSLIRRKFGIALLSGLFHVASSGVLAESKLPLLIAYFVPTDRVPIPGYVDRLDGVMTEVQRFYRDGMQAAGYGPLTFDLPRDTAGKLDVRLVHGKHDMGAYGRGDSDKVRGEVEAELTTKGIATSQRTLVIFQTLLKWEGSTAVEVGPYVGGGSHLAGTAWVYDDALLDPRKLGSKEPGGFYGRPCSVGEFNSHYVGGVAHELGHALGLPHVAGPRSEPRHSLMGDGNHTYGEELRNEGSGTYLHPASAMLLARCRPFVGAIEGAEGVSRAELAQLDASFKDSQVVLAGKLEAEPAAFGIVAYDDLVTIPGDYDAKGWVCGVDGSGRFRLAISELQPGPYELRLQVCHTNGGTSGFAYRYEVDSSNVPDLSAFSDAFLLFQQAMRAFVNGDRGQVESRVVELEARSTAPAELLCKAKHLRTLLHPDPPRSLATVPAGQKEVQVSTLSFLTESVGWGVPRRDMVLPERNSPCLLQVGGKFHERGLYAHAPSRYALQLTGEWKRLKSGYGLQDGHDGSVRFIIRIDGKDIFCSDKIRDHQLRMLDLDLTGASRLEMVVDDAGDGANSDWAVWIAPRLQR